MKLTLLSASLALGVIVCNTNANALSLDDAKNFVISKVAGSLDSKNIVQEICKKADISKGMVVDAVLKVEHVAISELQHSWNSFAVKTT